ncbi:hypothetical protein VQ042_14105 [Aurantimonas sp. A2-1-M11]|uniref:hypothetical protein n=1 Tax=Aurantimonas sp. A2-1-M11 TaxID=3113712 RepID=UPI002F934006
MKSWTIIAAIVAGSVSAASSSSWADSVPQAAVDCGCASELAVAANGSSALGTVTAATDDVLMSRPAGLGPAEPGAILTMGSRVLSGPRGAASLSLGSGCVLDVAANSAVTIGEADGKLCVRVASMDAAAGTQFSTTSSFGQQMGDDINRPVPQSAIGFPEVAGGLIGVAGVASVTTGVLEDDKSNPVSK